MVNPDYNPGIFAIIVAFAAGVIAWAAVIAIAVAL